MFWSDSGFTLMPLDCLVLTGELTRDQMLDELRHTSSEFQRIGVPICYIEFGFAWNLADDEKARAVAPAHVEALIRDQERLGAGLLGEDDVRLRTDGIEVLFCHDSDVHVFHDVERLSLVAGWAERWISLGGSPSFWRRDPNTGGMRRTTPEVG